MQPKYNQPTTILQFVEAVLLSCHNPISKLSVQVHLYCGHALMSEAYSL